MKFAKTLEGDQQPELHALYKQLKKSLRIFEGPADAGSAIETRSPPSSSDEELEEVEAAAQQAPPTGQEPAGSDAFGSAQDDSGTLASDAGEQQQQHCVDPAQEAHFVALVEACVQQLNEDYISREEMLVIKADLAQQSAAAAVSREQVLAAYRSVVDLHGELVLLCHWSMMAYTGIVKILKKHYKRTGQRVQSAMLGGLLSQPFCSLEEVRGLVRSAEELIAQLGEKLGLEPSGAPMTGSAAAAAMRDPAADQQQQQQLGALLDRGSPDTSKQGMAAVGVSQPPQQQQRQQAPQSVVQVPTQQHRSAPQQPDPPQPHQQQQMERGGSGSVEVVAASGRVLLKRDRSKVYSPTNKRHEAQAPAECGAAAQSSGSSMQVSQGGAHQQQQQQQQLPQPEKVSGSSAGGTPAGGSPTSSAAEGQRRPTIMQRTKAALQLWRSLRSNASTPSTILDEPSEQQPRR